MNGYLPPPLPGGMPPRPPVWQVHKETQPPFREYFHNPMTGQTVWEKPVELMTEEEVSCLARIAGLLLTLAARNRRHPMDGSQVKGQVLLGAQGNETDNLGHARRGPAELGPHQEPTSSASSAVSRIPYASLDTVLIGNQECLGCGTRRAPDTLPCDGPRPPRSRARTR